MRLLLLIAVILLFVDAFFYSGAYTQAAFMQVTRVADEFVSLVGEAVRIGPDQESSTRTTQI